MYHLVVNWKIVAISNITGDDEELALEGHIRISLYQLETFWLSYRMIFSFLALETDNFPDLQDLVLVYFGEVVDHILFLEWLVLTEGATKPE